MSDDDQVTALLTRVAQGVVVLPAPPVSTFASRARRRQLAQRLTVAAGVVVMALLVTFVVVVSGTGHRVRVTTPSAPNSLVVPTPSSAVGSNVSATVFGVPTGDVLVFDDGYDGVATVDLDNRTVSRRVVQGQIAGDQPWRLTTSGGDLIVGWGEVYAAPLAGGPSRLLGDATISVPAAEPGEVWLVTYAGGSLGEGTPTVREVTTDGRIIVPATSPSPDLGLGLPVVGVPGGITFQTAHGLALWDATSGKVTQILGSSQVSQAGVPAGDRLAWCGGPCPVLHVTTLGAGGRDQQFSPPARSNGFQADTARFSPDGRYLAVVANGPTEKSGSANIMIIDLETGTSRVIAQPATLQGSVAWAPDGGRMFFAYRDGANQGVPGDTNSVGSTTADVNIGMFDPGNGSTRTATIPVAVQGAFVVVPASKARSLLATQLGLAADCPSPVIQPSNRSGICGYRF